MADISFKIQRVKMSKLIKDWGESNNSAESTLLTSRLSQLGKFENDRILHHRYHAERFCVWFGLFYNKWQSYQWKYKGVFMVYFQLRTFQSANGSHVRDEVNRKWKGKTMTYQ